MKKTASLPVYIVLGIVLFAVFYFAVDSIWSLVGIDWNETFFPAVQKVIQGQSPYDVPTFRNAPWTILLLLPFGLFPQDVGGVLYFIASLAMYAVVAFRLKASPVAFIAFMFSPPVVYGMRMLNVDAFVLLGFVLPAPVGLFFVLIKPQMGIALVFYWLSEAWRNGGIKSVFLTFTPVTISLLASFFLFGNWVAGRQSDLLSSGWNASLWPWALPIGLVMVALSVRDRRKDLGMAASPFLSPYLAYHSWVSVLTGLIQYDLQMVVAVVGMWLAGYIHSFSI